MATRTGVSGPGLAPSTEPLKAFFVERDMNRVVREHIIKSILGTETITVLTGAGISAESGIPTFRGPEGFWTIGAQEYHPQEMATLAMFAHEPEEVWMWYLYRLGICRSAEPNPGHCALTEMERLLQGRFTLVTQNVDGLHLRAGNSAERTLQIHGNINYMRCSAECSQQVYPIPAEVAGKARGESLTATDRRLLCCPKCGTRSRPHVLWFDETYNQHHYRYLNAIEAARQTTLLLIVGTSGATSLPVRIAGLVHDRGGTIINLDISENPFASLALESGRGFFLRGASGSLLPQLVAVMAEALGT